MSDSEILKRGEFQEKLKRLLLLLFFSVMKT